MNFIRLTRKDRKKILVNMDCVSMVVDDSTEDKIKSLLYFIERDDYVEVLESMESINGLMAQLQKFKAFEL